MSPWLHVIGAGEGEPPHLPRAKIVLGPSRLKSRVPDLIVSRQPNLEGMLAQIVEHRGTPTVALASGDPMWFGIGATLARHLDPAEFRVHPAPSSLQLAAARLRWPQCLPTPRTRPGSPTPKSCSARQCPTAARRRLTAQLASRPTLISR